MTVALGPDVGNHKTTCFWELFCFIPPLNVGWGGGAEDVEIITRFLTSTLRTQKHKTLRGGRSLH